MKISQNSSLYKLARLGWMSERSTRNTNLCAVFWCSLWGFAISIGMAVGIAGIVFVLLEAPIISLIGFLTTSIWAPDGLTVVGMMFDSIVIGGGLIAWVVCNWDEKRRAAPDFYQKQAEKQRQREENPGLLRTAYRSWKDKTCVMIQFEDAA